MRNNPVSDKSRLFAIRIVKLYQYLQKRKHVYPLANQVLRSGTSVGANVTEALCAQSKKDFLAKMYIAFKECSETEYWLDLLHSTNYPTNNQYESIKNDCQELRKLLAAITKTTKSNNS